MTHANRGRLTVNADGNWRLYATTIPAGADVLGTVTQGAETGALIRCRGSGLYAQINAGAVRSLDQRKVSAAMGAAGGSQS